MTAFIWNSGRQPKWLRNEFPTPATKIGPLSANLVATVPAYDNSDWKTKSLEPASVSVNMVYDVPVDRSRSAAGVFAYDDSAKIEPVQALGLCHNIVYDPAGAPQPKHLGEE